MVLLLLLLLLYYGIIILIIIQRTRQVEKGIEDIDTTLIQLDKFVGVQRPDF